jgi:hypothetical protein
MGRTLYILLAICVAALIYLKKGWESIDLANITVENGIVLALIIVVIVIGAIFLSPYLKARKLAFREGKPDKEKLYGGKDIT